MNPHPHTRHSSPHHPRALPWAVLWLAALLAAPVAARCLDEESLQSFTGAEAPAAAAPEPRQVLQLMVRDALARSNAVGASALLAEAAVQDINETRAAQAVQANLGGGFGPGGNKTVGIAETSATQLRASVSVSKTVYDGGRVDRLVDWRTQLAESARYGHLSQQEQISLMTVTLALERSRYRSQTQVYRQSTRKMSCLVEALETIVRADRGRASELVQAQKSLQQAELAQEQSQSMVRQIEIRLRRLVGDGLPSADGLSTVFSGVPPLAQLVADVEKSADIAALDAQAAAAGRYAAAVEVSGRPVVSLAATGNAAVSYNGSQGGNRGNVQNGSYSVGVLFSVPLLNPGLESATDAARKRAQAARLQRADEVETRRFRVAEVHEQALSSIDRARRVAEVLRESEQVRNFTLQQWQQLGRRSLFDVMGAESEHYSLRVAYVNALHDVQMLNANLLALGRGVSEWLR
jgi:outer membrane protein, adhesin transport system